MWQVQITKEPLPGIFKSNYFPRKTHYKLDAIKLVEEVRRRGGEAVVVWVKK